MKSFRGVLYLIGSLRYSRKNAHQLWDNSEGNGLESCYLTMTEKRFRFFLRCIRFDDIRDRNTRKETDKLAPIREIFDVMIRNFQKYYSASEYFVIDSLILSYNSKNSC